VIDRGLALGPDAGRAYELHAENLSTRYSRACSLDRLGRHEEAIAEWQAIIDWSRERGNNGDIAWPEREITRLRDEIRAR
jgi:hypothetical protein